MNPVSRLFRRSRVFRVIFYLSMVPLWALLQFICGDSFSAYSHVGNITLILLLMCFALWAWWHSEDRDRRAAARAAAHDGAVTSPNGDNQHRAGV